MCERTGDGTVQGHADVAIVGAGDGCGRDGVTAVAIGAGDEYCVRPGKAAPRGAVGNVAMA